MLTGLEVLLQKTPKRLKGKSIGLVVHPASVDHSLNHAVELLHGHKDFQITALFGPQHGIRGETQDNMIEWEGFVDERTGLPVYSLYGASREPTAEMMKDIDIMVVDLQDVGTRVYTFTSTLFLVMEACSRHGREVVVLDRPNPINGIGMEGYLLEAQFRSFVGMLELPMRHGLTMGELACMYRAARGLACPLQVVRMCGWRREWWFGSTKLPWVMPSPNMPTPDTAAVYPGTVIFEGTNISEGRGTTRPFEIIGAPRVEPEIFAGAMNSRNQQGVHFRPLFFQPTFHKWAGELCGGVQIHITDREKFQPFLTALSMLVEITRRWGEHLRWKEPPYEYEKEKLSIDIIAGTNKLRIGLEKGRTADEMQQEWMEGLNKFADFRKDFLLY
ncbi:MAG: DUF1343 domain-containing protein [bacterium]